MFSNDSSETAFYDIDTLDDDLDSFSLDSSYYAACAYSGGIPEFDEHDKTKLAEFWTWYLNDAIPEVVKT